MVVVRSNEKETEDDNEAEIWGTWEELLLACAVNRHGTHNWDSVASELRLRSVNGDVITADKCKLRYQLLNRRFNCPDEIEGESTVEIPWLDELRKLRVAELRREVQRHDVSIGSLQLKVKRLEEERERTVQEEAAPAGDGTGSGSGSDPKPAGDSCRESNSTEPKPDKEVKPDVDQIEADRVGNTRSGSEPVTGGGEASYNGSSETIAKDASAVRSTAGEVYPMLNESGESFAESKGGQEEEGTSSASLSRRRAGGRRRRVSSVEPVVGVESQPLITFLDFIRSNKKASVLLDRGVENQEGERYRSLIRRHVDFEMVRNRVGRSGYGSTEFFRDLLLLCNNALVFYPNNSPESISAVSLRHLINKEISVTLRKTPQPSPQSQRGPTPPPPPPLPIPPPPAQHPKADPDRVDKPSVLSPLVVCRKRSNISSKPAKKADKVEKVKEEKVEPKKEKENEVEAVEEKEKEKEKGKEKVVDKKSTKQRSAMARGLRTNNTRSGGGGGGSTLAKKDPKPEPVEEEPKSPPVSMAKKKGAANFLSRIKKSSPNGTLIEALKGGLSSKENGKEGGGGHSKKRAKEESKKESSSNAAKRNVGRPSKRAAAPAKRTREERAAPTARKRGRR